MHPSALSFFRKTVLFVATCLLWLVGSPAFSQTDTVYQKPSLNNGMPPATPAPPPVIVKPPPPVVKSQESDKERKKREKEEKADEKEKVPLQEKLFTGGTGGLQFGNVTFIQVSPIIGYKLTEWLGAGAGFSYYYLSDGFDDLSITGGKLFIQGKIYKELFGHAEYEFIPYNNTVYNALLIGPGYRQMFTEKVGLDLMYLFNASPNANNIYNGAFFRGGLYIDF